jgi:hypothetical protein
MNTNTDYSKQCEILEDLWINHTNNEIFEDFIELNDLGLPLAHMIANGIVESTPLAQEIVQQSFEDLLELLEVKDVGFSNLKQML